MSIIELSIIGGIKPAAAKGNTYLMVWIVLFKTMQFFGSASYLHWSNLILVSRSNQIFIHHFKKPD